MFSDFLIAFALFWIGWFARSYAYPEERSYCASGGKLVCRGQPVKCENYVGPDNPDDPHDPEIPADL